MKAGGQYFPVVLFIMLYKVVLTFESVDEICVTIEIKGIELSFCMLLSTLLYKEAIPGLNEILKGALSWRFFCILVKTAQIFLQSENLFSNTRLPLEHGGENMKIMISPKKNKL